MDVSNFQDILNFAISREKEAITSYGILSELTKSPGLKELLLELQEEEKKHKSLLEGITDQKIASFVVKEVPDLKISDYLTDETPSEDMNFQDLLIFAAKKEQEAVELYSNLEENAEEHVLEWD